MAELSALIERFDVNAPAFVADPYPTLNALREASPIFWNERTGQWIVTRFADIAAALRDRRLGRAYTHRYSHAELGRPEPDAPLPTAIRKRPPTGRQGNTSTTPEH